MLMMLLLAIPPHAKGAMEALCDWPFLDSLVRSGNGFYNPSTSHRNDLKFFSPGADSEGERSKRLD
jgi:hypothetical protein